MTGSELDEYTDDELDALERKKIRRMLQENDRAHWLWSFLMKCVIAATALAGFVAATKGYVVDVARWIAR